MNLPQQIATHFRTVYFGNNWTDVNLKDSLAGVDWELATTQIYSCNTIAVLIFHMNYYVSNVLKVLRGQPLEASDKNAFDCPPVMNQEDWENLQKQVFADAEAFAIEIEKLPESKLGEIFQNEKYGNYYRNLHGIVEHNHYQKGKPKSKLIFGSWLMRFLGDWIFIWNLEFGIYFWDLELDSCDLFASWNLVFGVLLLRDNPKP